MFEHLNPKNMSNNLISEPYTVTIGTLHKVTTGRAFTFQENLLFANETNFNKNPKSA